MNAIEILAVEEAEEDITIMHPPSRSPCTELHHFHFFIPATLQKKKKQTKTEV